MNLLFSYGTLQDEPVQVATYGRTLGGTAAVLLGYRMGKVAISDPEVVRTSGKPEHPIAIPTGSDADEIAGTVLSLTDEELAASDDYEVDEYQRVKAPLKDGRRVWVYVLAEGLSPAD